MSEKVLIKRRTAKIILAFFSILPLTIVADEALYRIFGDVMFRYEVLISLGLHTINLQSAVADVFFFAALFMLAHAIFKHQ